MTLNRLGISLRKLKQPYSFKFKSIVVFLLLLLFFFSSNLITTKKPITANRKSSNNPNNESKNHLNKAEINPLIKLDTIHKLFNLIARSKPKSSPLKNYYSASPAKEKFFTDTDFFFTKDYLENLLMVDTENQIQLYLSYEWFFHNFKKLNMDVFGDSEHKNISGRGVVLVGGGKYSWLSLINIHQLRSTGSNLPVEVYLPTEDSYDKDFCENILPDINAKCVLGYKELPLDEYKNYFAPVKFEYKILSIFASSFEEVLLLDSDNVVLYNPDKLFDWEVYKNNQLILWPDCWARTTHPFFYDLTHIEVSDVPRKGSVKNNEYNFHDLPGTIPNPSTESGMLLVNKRSQVDTLLLALYMNIYGSDFYYPLLTQGSAGEGDKETYIAAAYALQSPVYQIKQKMSFLGYSKDGSFHSKALGQCDPTTEHESEIPDGEMAGCEGFLFIHMSYPKLFPTGLLKDIRTKDGEDVILYENAQWSFKYDFELRIWEIFTQLLCKNYHKNEIDPENPESDILDEKFRLSGHSLSYIKDNNDIDDYCSEYYLPHLEFLRKYFKNGDKLKNQFKQNF